MQTAPRNRPYQVDEEIGAFLFKLYELLFTSKINLRAKQKTFESAADSNDSWKVVSISKAALLHIKNTGTAETLRRGHKLSRSDRAKHLFENRETPMSQVELLNFFFEHDTVSLVTKEENLKDGTDHWSELYPVPDGLFNAGSFSIYVRKGKEIPWVNSMAE